MTEYHLLDPEVPGGFGDDTELDTSTHPPVVHSLTMEFDGWLGDQIVNSFPVYLVTASLAAELEKAAATGYRLAPVTVRTTDKFHAFFGSKELPPFHWLQITGTPWEDDFFIHTDFRLAVSKKILDLILATRPAALDCEPVPRP